MPLCQLYTSRKDAELKDGIELRLAEVIAKTLSKPLESVMVVILPCTRMVRNATLDPSCLLVIHSINVFDANRNPGYTPAIKQALQTEFDLPPERCVIQYVDLERSFLG